VEKMVPAKNNGMLDTKNLFGIPKKNVKLPVYAPQSHQNLTPMMTVDALKYKIQVVPKAVVTPTLENFVIMTKVSKSHAFGVMISAVLII
jgi:hypothetical protein